MALATQRSVVDASSSEVPIVAAARAVGGNALAESVEDATSAENDLGTAIARTLDGGLGKSLDSAGSDSGLPSETVESCFAAVCALMNQMDPRSTRAAVERIAAPLCNASAPNQRLRLLCLQHLCNAVPSSQPHTLARAFTIALQHANACGMPSVAAPSARKVSEIAKSLQNQPELERELWLAARTALDASDSRGLESHGCAVRYLRTFQGTPTSELEHAADVAAEVVVGFLNCPSAFQADFAQLDAIRNLRNSSQHSVKLQVLQTFLTSTLDEMEQVVEKRRSEMEQHGIEVATVLRKMRLNTLVQIAEDTPNQAIDKGEVASQLKVDVESVDSWIIAAMGAQIVEASIDEMNNTVTFMRLSPRVFGAREWDSLRSRLATWRDRIQNVRSQLQNRVGTKVQTPANPLSAATTPSQ